MKASRVHRTKRNRRGAALVEMAVCLPVLVMIVLGIIEFGRGMMVSELIYDGARVGARQAILASSTNDSVTQSVNTFLQATTVNAQAATITIAITPAAGNPDPANQIASAHTGDVCTVQVQIPYDQVSYIPGTYLTGKMLSGTCSMLHE